MSHNTSLRDVQETDIEIFFEQQLEPEAVRMAAFPARDHQCFMSHWEKGMRKKTTFLQTIIYKEEVAGNIVCWEQDGKCNVGYWLGKEYWGIGIASVALKLFLSKVSKRPLSAHVAKHNIASIRVLQKNGFTHSPSGKFPGAVGEKGEELIMTLE